MITIEPKNKDFVAVLVDGEQWRLLHKKRFRSEFSQIKAFDSLTALEEGFEALEKSVAMRYVQNLLALKGYFSSEIKTKLRQQKFSDGIICAVIETMTKYGYLNDKAHKEGLIKSYVKKGYGEKLIAQKLMAKLKDVSEIKELNTHSLEEEKEAIYRWLNKRAVAREAISQLPPKERQKHQAFLLRKGFSYEAVSEILFDF